MSKKLIAAACWAWIAVGLVSFSQAEESTGVKWSAWNGENLQGWHVTGCKTEVKEGALLLAEGDGFVRSDAKFADFVLELDWRALKAEQYDSGIYIRCDLPPEGKVWPRTYQINLKQGQEGNLLGMPNGSSQGLIQVGKWNHFKLTVVGDKASMEINGKPAWSTAGLKAASGYIGFQAEVPLGGQFEFKNIHITELGYRSLFNGQDLAGWEGAGSDAAACWKVENGLLTCTGKKGPWLRSKEQYGDFNLRLDYQVQAGGNSGVYVRVPADGKHHGEGAGVEIQVLDDKDEKYKNLKPYQYTGSVYAVAPALQHVGRGPGQWNSMEINCQGSQYRITHNGVVIVQADAETFPELKVRNASGFFGLQNHSTEVYFRNLRVGPPLP